MKRVLLYSFGADSTAILLLAIKEKKLIIDEVLYSYNGELSEPKAIKDQKNRIIKLIKENNIEYTEVIVNDIEKNIIENKEFCGIQSRNQTKEKCSCNNQNVINIIGYTYDEPNRIYRKEDNITREYPLIELKITHQEAINICYKYGYEFNFGEYRHYDLIRRTGCPICSYQKNDEIIIRYILEPEIIQKIKELEKIINKPFKPNKYIDEIIKEEIAKYNGKSNIEILEIIKNKRKEEEKMRQIKGTVIGVKKPKEYGKKYAIHMTYEENRVNGLAVCTAYTDKTHDIGEELTVIESNFRYMILE